MMPQSAQVVKVRGQCAHYDGVSLLKMQNALMNFTVMTSQSAQIMKVRGQSAHNDGVSLLKIPS
jgi:Ni,Fe-hydrogenase I small subunit